MPTADVIVVGAGLAGLIAARELRRRGVDVIVLESADRSGGRVLTETSALGSKLDLGGQWIGHDHHRVMTLADELGIARFPMHTGTLPRAIEGPRRLHAAAPSFFAAAVGVAILGVQSRRDLAHSSNEITLADRLRAIPWRRSRRLLEVIASVSWTADLDRMSLRAAVAMIRQQGGLKTMLSTRGGAQDSLMVEGAGALVSGLVAELGPVVRTGQRVTAIERGDGGVMVRTSEGTMTAIRAIVTVPPPSAAHIAHRPALPESRLAVENAMYMGSVYKAIAVYERPFWRELRGGEFLILDKPGGAVFDTTAPGGPGHLCMLVGGPEARALDELDTDARRRMLLDRLVAHLGPEVADPVSWHEKAWHRDEHAGGGYMALPLAGIADGLLPVPSTPIGRVHWAGTETAREHPGYLDGAIESGSRVAHEVAAALSATDGAPSPD